MLLNQCIADAEDKIADSGKIVKININADSAMVMGDGDKLYRVFQNIVDNALNYSMDGTRIFLDVYKKTDRIVFAEKNISATPINFTEEEILERFVRGDKSRTDVGSGLGLSISKSFTEACGCSSIRSPDGGPAPARLCQGPARQARSFVYTLPYSLLALSAVA